MHPDLPVSCYRLGGLPVGAGLVGVGAGFPGVGVGFGGCGF